MSQDIDLMRRNPTQKRASDTVDTIFEATARIVEQGNEARLTTNHIAERAGFSVGTLYGYFPNKRSVLQAMALRERKRQEEQVMTLLHAVGPEHSDADIVRIVIRAALKPFGNRSRLRLGLMRIITRDKDALAAMRDAQEQVLDVLLSTLATRCPTMPGLSPTTRFTLIAAVTGAIQSAVDERPDLFESSGFEDDLVYMVLGFLGGSDKAG